MQSYISVNLDSTSKRLETSARRKVLSRQQHGTNFDGKQRKRLTKEACKFWFRKVVAFLFSQVGVGALLLGYTILGAMMFISLESSTDSRRVSQVTRIRNQTVSQLWNVTHNYNVIHTEKWREEVEMIVRNFQSSLAREIRLGYDGSSDPVWTFPAALMYSLSVYTTIGYGNLRPKTEWGKTLTCFYALVGIPLLLLYMANVGDLLATSFLQFYSFLDRCKMRLRKAREERLALDKSVVDWSLESNEKRQSQREFKTLELEDQRVSLDNECRANDVTIPVSTCLAVFFCYVCVGSMLFSWWENWNYLDGSYFCFVSLVTIGFGDLVPGNSPADRNRKEVDGQLILCSIYILLGMALMAMCFHLTQERFFLTARRLGKKLHLI